MFSPLNIGTGLGGFFQGLQQQQQSDLRNRAIAEELANQQRSRNALALALAGLKGSPNLFAGNQLPAGGLPMSNAPPVPTPAAAPMVPQPPAPGAASQPAQGNPRTADDAGMIDTPAMRASASMPQAGGTTDDLSTSSVPDMPAWAPAVAGAGGGTPQFAVAPQAQPQAAPAAAPETPAAPPPATQQIATGQTPGTPEQHNEISDYLQKYLHTTPLSDIVQAVTQASPNADPATAMMAVQELYKMSIQGSNLDKAIAAQIMGGLYHQGLLNVRGGELGVKQAVQAETVRRDTLAHEDRGAAEAGRAQRGAAGLEVRKEGLALAQKRYDATQANRALSRASTAQQQEFARRERQIADLDRRIGQMQNATPVDTKGIEQAVKDRNILVERNNQIMQQYSQQPAQ